MMTTPTTSLALGILLAVALCAEGRDADRDPGFTAFEQGEFATTEARFRAGVAAAEKEGADDLALADALDRLAWFFCMRARYADAEPLLRRALAIREAKRGPDHPEIARALHNLATLLAQEGDKAAEAERLFRRALALREKAPGDSALDLARTLDGLARLCWTDKRPGEGEILARGAVDIREKVVDIEPEKPAPEATHKGRVMLMLTYRPTPSEAALLMDQRLEICGRDSHDERVRNAAIFSQIAGYRMSHLSVRSSMTLYERAVTLQEEAHAAENVLTAEALDFLGDRHVLRGEHAEAETLQRRALAIWEKLLGPSDLKVAHRLAELATTLMAQERDRDAAVLLQRAVTIMDRPSGVANTDVGEDRAEYARRLQRARRNVQLVERIRPTDADLNYLKGLATGRLTSLKYQFLSRDLTALESLSLCFSAIDDDGMAHLRGLINLETLNLDHTKVGDAGWPKSEHSGTCARFN